MKWQSRPNSKGGWDWDWVGSHPKEKSWQSAKVPSQAQSKSTTRIFKMLERERGTGSLLFWYGNNKQENK